MTAPVYRVLIADDEPLLRKVIKDELERLGHKVVGQAEDGVQALDMAGTLKPDIVLMDVSMPEMDGLEAARQIREKCPCPVVLLTAYDEPSMIAKAGNAGVGAYLVKPPDASTLTRAMAISVARFGDLQELRRLHSELLVAERQRVMLQSIGAACHHISQPATILISYLQMMRKMPQPEGQGKMLDDCVDAAERIVDILKRLQKVSEYRTVPYLDVDINESIIDL